MPFITFEGIEGCGKSTQVRLLVEWLGRRAVSTREPGGTALGRSIRGLLLDRSLAPAPTTEVLLFFADRAQHVAEVVRPALARGLFVVSDRYLDSTFAYQGYGRGVDLAQLRAVAELATGGLGPDATVLLDVPVEVGLRRVGRRGVEDRMEAEQMDFHERVRRGFLELAAQEPERFIVQDGEAAPESVSATIREALVLRGLGRGAHGV